jgi:hypothetical protein
MLEARRVEEAMCGNAKELGYDALAFRQREA